MHNLHGSGFASTSASASTSTSQSTILSSLEKFTAQNVFSSSSNALHPFASSPRETLNSMRELIETTSLVAISLNAHSAASFSNPKLLSLYRQRSAIAHAVHITDQNLRHTIETLRSRSGVLYGENIPLDQDTLVEWCISRFEAWGASAGMETFREEEREGRLTLVLGGKVLVIDIDLSIARTTDSQGRAQIKIGIANVKTSYAIPNGGSAGTTMQGSASLDGLLRNSLVAFLDEVQKASRVDGDGQDGVKAARLGKTCQDHLKCLMMLDHLALSEGDAGLKWFRDVDELALEVERFAMSEAQAIISSTAASPSTSVPLDIFLMRAHTLPLPYLISPSISFLTYLSPSAYLSVLRSVPSPSSSTSRSASGLPLVDIPLDHLRHKLLTHPRPRGITIATLVLSAIPSDSTNIEGDSVLPQAADPLSTNDLLGHGIQTTFSLLPSGARINHTFPQVQVQPGVPSSSYKWMLDFTDNGNGAGIVMSQTRMRAIEAVVDPSSPSRMDPMAGMHLMYGTGSWFDLLLNPNNPMSPERYSATYESPSNAHPPLHLRLTAPEEPGFILEKVPVRTLQEIWAVLEIVREQCWLNETLSICEWLPEGLSMIDIEPAPEEGATEEELDAVLKGAITPRRIPVNVYLPSHPPPEPLFDPTSLDPTMSLSLAHLDSSPRNRLTKIVLTSPERPPISGLVEIGVTFDPGRPRAVAVDVSGAMGVNLQGDLLEEVCRRGGALGLPGRVWAKARSGT